MYGAEKLPFVKRNQSFYPYHRILRQKKIVKVFKRNWNSSAVSKNEQSYLFQKTTGSFHQLDTFIFSWTALQNSSNPSPFKADTQTISCFLSASNFSFLGSLTLSTCHKQQWLWCYPYRVKIAGTKVLDLFQVVNHRKRVHRENNITALPWRLIDVEVNKFLVNLIRITRKYLKIPCSKPPALELMIHPVPTKLHPLHVPVAPPVDGWTW